MESHKKILISLMMQVIFGDHTKSSIALDA